MRRKGAVVAVIKNDDWVYPKGHKSDSVTQQSKPGVGLGLLSRTGYVNPSATVSWVGQSGLNVQVGVTNPGLPKSPNVGLRLTSNPNYRVLNALTSAALILPGLFSNPAFAAEGDEVDFQYSHYQEGKRDISGYDDAGVTPNGLFNGKSFNPIEVEGLKGSAKISLTDRIKFAFNYSQDTWGGATPVSTAPVAFDTNHAVVKNGIIVGATPYVQRGGVFLDDNLTPLRDIYSYPDPITGLPIKNSQLTHVMAYASPETRKQGDFKLSYDWGEAAVSIGGGISIEDDYVSRFGNIGTRLDFNQKTTTLNVDLSYTNSDTSAILDHDSYASGRNAPPGQYIEAKDENGGPLKTVRGNRQDWATHLGISQILNKDAVIGADFSYTRSTGYMANPYKSVSMVFIDREEQEIFGQPGALYGSLKSYLEQRPEVRNQWNLGGRYVQFINPLDAALHFDYRFSADDWGIQAHTFEADWVQPVGGGWTVTPRIRYYSQDAADFYTPWLVSFQKNINSPPDGQLPFNPKKLFDPSNRSGDFTKYYSSDHRLSGYGTLSGGITVTKQFAKGLTVETGFEYYTHQGGLKIGGGGEGSYADFDYWLANAALKVNLEALALGAGGGGNHDHSGHAHHGHGVHAPAGVMFDHMLPKAGDFMVGYRYMWNSQGGAMLHGTNPVSDQAIVNNGCVETGSLGCFLAPDSMAMHMHMLDLMFAPTDWLTLMLMPQFMDMGMSMRKLDGVTGDLGSTGLTGLGGHISHHTQNVHETGGIGDLGMYALVKLFDNGTHHLHVTAGLSAPTADVDIQLRRGHTLDGGFIHYGMQLGSGTWDFKPSVTYTGQIDDFSWGAQANGTVRMEDKNKSGYALGDLFQATAWGSYNLTNWLTASVRGVYTLQGGIKGQFNGSNGQFSTPDFDSNGQPIPSSILKFGPQDYPANYGGRFWDVGFGLSAMVPSGDLAGNRFSVEWLQPVEDDVNGYQLERDGALSATWSVAF